MPSKSAFRHSQFAISIFRSQRDKCIAFDCSSFKQYGKKDAGGAAQRTAGLSGPGRTPCQSKSVGPVQSTVNFRTERQE